MRYLYSPLLLITLLILSGCGKKSPVPYPKYPNYEIIKPTVKYAASRKSLAKMVKQLQGSPYVWAEEGPDCFDCSGFTYYMYGSMGIEIPRVAREQARVGKRVNPKDLKYGDLLFFATNRHNRRKITHVGVYLGNGWFTHASTAKKEVVYTNLYTSPYYKKRLRICRRYLPDKPYHTNRSTLHNMKAWRDRKYRKDKGSADRRAVIIKAPLEKIEQITLSRDTYYVQVGSFSGVPDRDLLNTISHKGFSYRVIKFPTPDTSISKLLIGPYRTHKEAEQVLARVRKEIEPNAFIAQIR